MLTQCPHCDAVFRLRAAFLIAARGHVECGACNRVFFALERLADEPLVAVESPSPPPPVQAAAPAVRQAGSDDDSPIAGPARLTREASPDVTPTNDEARRQARAARRAEQRWGGLARGLLLLFALQVAWAAREPLGQQFPVAASRVRELCSAWGCASLLPPPDAPFAPLTATLEPHPHQPGALLFNATFANRLDVPAPYPALELRLQDEAGNTIAARRFLPREYLGVDVAPAALAGGATATAVVEVAIPSRPAARFDWMLKPR